MLDDGRVLVAGGRDLHDRTLDSAEIYDPATGRWLPTASMTTPRFDHTATLLADGRVLVAGGMDCRRQCTAANYLTSAEIYDPTSGTWTAIAPMRASRARHVAIALPSGPVLVSGGAGLDPGDAAPAAMVPPALRSAELYDPDRGAWLEAAPMHRARSGAMAAGLPDGRGVVAGGFDNELGSKTPRTDDELWSAALLTAATLELYDYASNSWRLSPPAETHRIRWIGVLPDGLVLSLGGFELEEARLYDVNANAWAAMPIGQTLRAVQPVLTLLVDGSALATGGLDNFGDGLVAVDGAARFEPAVGGWSATRRMTVPRAGHAAVRLKSGSVLVYGGYELRAGRFGIGRERVPVLSSEVFDPETAIWSPRGP